MVNEADILAKHFSLEELCAGEYFVKEGQYSKIVGYVESGLLHSYQIDHNGDEITTNFFQKDSFCASYYSLHYEEPALDSIKVITNARIHVITYDKLQLLLRDNLMLNQLARREAEKACISKDIRLSKMLKLDAKNRYLWFLKEYPFVVKKSPLKFIASYLGMKPESLSRIRKDLVS